MTYINSGFNNELPDIKTFYEHQFLDQGMKINYLCFELPHDKAIEEPAEENSNDNFFDRVYEVVQLIPEGRVTTYGAIARYTGSPRLRGW